MAMHRIGSTSCIVHIYFVFLKYAEPELRNQSPNVPFSFHTQSKLSYYTVGQIYLKSIKG